MTSRLIPVSPFLLIVFGATGDLAQRKILPALYRRDRAGQLPDDAHLIGLSRREIGDEGFRSIAKKAIVEHVAKEEVDKKALDRFLARIEYLSLDVGSDHGWSALKQRVKRAEEQIRVFYLSTAPELFGPICERIGQAGMVDANTRVVVEKPIGKSLQSARAVNDAVGKVFPEDRVYRIDHYLGKETVQNLMALRFANALFEPLWRAEHIDHVQITVAETLGVGSRVGYYDGAGAMRDMVQNHMLQLVCLTAMEPPRSMDADSVRDEKLKVLKSLDPITEDRVDTFTVRGQYRAGASDGGAVPGYLDELESHTSNTETFVALKLGIGNWRWAGVPFYLRTGKRLPRQVSEIVIAFRTVPYSAFDGSNGPILPNRLVIRLQPDEGVKLWLMIKDPGPGGMRLQHVPLDMSFKEQFGAANPDAYERLILDVVRGNQTLFMRRDEVEAAWTWVDPILEAWASRGKAPAGYTAGTFGPSAAVALIERDGRTWHDDDD